MSIAKNHLISYENSPNYTRQGHSIVSAILFLKSTQITESADSVTETRPISESRELEFSGTWNFKGPIKFLAKKKLGSRLLTVWYLGSPTMETLDFSAEHGLRPYRIIEKKSKKINTEINFLIEFLVKWVIFIAMRWILNRLAVEKRFIIGRHQHFLSTARANDSGPLKKGT